MVVAKQGGNQGSGANGGDGVVVVRYQIAEETQTAKATGGAVSYYNNKNFTYFTILEQLHSQHHLMKLLNML